MKNKLNTEVGESESPRYIARVLHECLRFIREPSKISDEHATEVEATVENLIERLELSGDSPHPRESTLANVLQEVIDECTVCGSPSLGLVDKANAALDAYKAEAPHQPSQRAIQLLVDVRDYSVNENGYCVVCLADPHSSGCVIELVEKFVRELDEKAEHSEPAKEGGGAMNEPPVCARCEDEYWLRDGMEPTKYCDPCAHARVEELELLAVGDSAAPSQPQQESRAGFESWFAREYPDAKLYWADADSNWCYSIRTLIDPQPLWEVWQASRAGIVAAPSVQPGQAKGKYPIDRPCSACSAGDYEMKHHDHHPPFRAGCGPEATVQPEPRK